MKLYKIVLIFLLSTVFLSYGKSNSDHNIQTVVIKSDSHKVMLGLVVQTPEKDIKGAVVAGLVNDGPADKAGIQKNDRIVKVDTKTVETAEQLNEISAKWQEGQKIDLTLERKGKTVQIRVSVEEIKEPAVVMVQSFHSGEDGASGAYAFFSDSGENDDDPGKNIEVEATVDNDETPDIASGKKGGYLGIAGKTLRGQLKDYFEVKNGVLIENIIDDTPAKKSGLKAGDVITCINDRDIEDMQDLRRVLDYFNPDDEVAIYFVRKGRAKNIKVKLGKKTGVSYSFWNGDENNLEKNFKFLRIKLPRLNKRLKHLRVRFNNLREVEKLRYYLI